jgi:hypothetical protein
MWYLQLEDPVVIKELEYAWQAIAKRKMEATTWKEVQQLTPDSCRLLKEIEKEVYNWFFAGVAQ